MRFILRVALLSHEFIFSWVWSCSMWFSLVHFDCNFETEFKLFIQHLMLDNCISWNVGRTKINLFTLNNSYYILITLGAILTSSFEITQTWVSTRLKPLIFWFNFFPSISFWSSKLCLRFKRNSYILPKGK